MMRRIKALWLAVLTGALVVLLALGFALVQHPGAPIEEIPEIKRGS
jgi:hypothetical protein